MITFFITYFLLLIFGAIFCNGWHLITRGEIEILPNGEKKKVGAIFKWWALFWEHKTGKELIDYKGKELLKIFKTIQQAAKQNGYSGKFTYNTEHIEVDANIQKLIPFIENDSKYTVTYLTKEPRIVISREDDVYLFPEWIRSPTSACVTCYSSIYGSIIFWSFILLYKEDLFTIFTNEKFALFLTWILYCIALAFLNTFFYKRLHK